MPFQNLKEEHGCYVYNVVGNAVGVRSAPNVRDDSRTGTSFDIGELVSIDLVTRTQDATENGPFLRLSDGSGWLFEFKRGVRCLQRVSVETGLWVMYVDNVPSGQALRRHPVDRKDLKANNITFLPMQKLYCDRKVHQQDVTYYRVQGTRGWVFDVRKPINDGSDPCHMLLEEHMVKAGLFAFRAIKPVAVRSRPNVSDKSRTVWIVREGELVVVDRIRESPFAAGNGPFFRLADGSGWLFEHKHNERFMEEVKVKKGSWTFRIKNGDTGIGLRRQPIDGTTWFADDVVYKPGEKVECDRRIKSPSGVNFYRVEGTNGWVFDKRGETQMMELLYSDSPKAESSTKAGWSLDFVRGVAEACDGVEEISFNPTSRVVSFRTAEDARVNVYYTTRTIGTALDHPIQGKSQLFRRNCTNAELVAIMNNPRLHTNKGYQRTRARISDDSEYFTSGIVEEGEETARQALLECDAEVSKLLKRRQRLISSVLQHDIERSKYAVDLEKRRKERSDENLQLIEKRLLEEMRQKEEEERKRIQDLRCQECYRVFSSVKARMQHCRDAHFLQCDYCGKVFQTQHALDQHRDAVNHW